MGVSLGQIMGAVSVNPGQTHTQGPSYLSWGCLGLSWGQGLSHPRGFEIWGRRWGAAKSHPLAPAGCGNSAAPRPGIWPFLWASAGPSIALPSLCRRPPAEPPKGAGVHGFLGGPSTALSLGELWQPQQGLKHHQALEQLSRPLPEGRDCRGPRQTGDWAGAAGGRDGARNSVQRC